MKTKVGTIFFYCLFLLAAAIRGQTEITDVKTLADLKKIPKESIYIHKNNTVLFCGEYLYYTAFCINKKTVSLSNLSKIAYVELIGEDLDVVFKHQIWLEKGIGYGDFFIPISVPSGQYKLVGYTNWMKNGEANAVSISDILIINPYQSDQSGMFNEVEELSSDYDINDATQPILTNYAKDVNDVSITLDAGPYAKRKKVSITIKENEFRPKGGTYSVSVRKKNFVELPGQNPIVEHIDQSEVLSYELNDKVFLPELRGKLIKGRLMPNTEQIQIKEIDVAISIPEESGYFAISKTDELGRFYANIAKPYRKEEIVFRPITEDVSDYSILLDTVKSIPIDYEFEQIPIGLRPSMKNEIIKRSISNQVQNAYFEFRPDSLEAIKGQTLFKDKLPTTYVLDDYTRFKTLEETSTEILKDVFVKGSGKEKVIMVQGYQFHTNTGITPLILLDGVMVTNLNDFLNFDTRKISSIKVFRDHFVIGSNIYQGALLLYSNKNDSYLSLKDLTVRNNTYKNMLKKRYYRQNYSDDGDEIALVNSMPDYRYQLFWVPEFQSSAENSNLEFFTSDISGEFEVHIEGVSSKGEFVSLKKNFFVE